MNFWPVVAEFSPLIPVGKFDLIYGDPAWHYNNRFTGGERKKKNKTKFGGGAQKHYPTIPDPVMINCIAPMFKAIAADNAILLLWAVWPKMDFIIERFIPACGFQYKTEYATWVKTKKSSKDPIYGPGYYNGSNTEVVLLATREKKKPRHYFKPKVPMLGSVIHAPRGEHSQKPILHPTIDIQYPDFRKIELFARACYPGWTAWGNQKEKFEIEENMLIKPETVLEPAPQLQIFRDIVPF